MPMLSPRSFAPPFAMRDHNRIVTTLEEFRGHYVVMWWYPKADTPG